MIPFFPLFATSISSNDKCALKKRASNRYKLKVFNKNINVSSLLDKENHIDIVCGSDPFFTRNRVKDSSIYLRVSVTSIILLLLLCPSNSMATSAQRFFDS